MFLINTQSKEPIFEQIQTQILRFIKAGVLSPGDRLPSVRQLAQENGINPNTVSKAYIELEKNSYVHNIPKKGVYVSSQHTRSTTKSNTSFIKATQRKWYSKERFVRRNRNTLSGGNMLKIDQLQKSFGNKQILNNLCLEIPEGTIFGLVGINGAGKSTLLRCIAGVYEPEQGSILFNDSDTYEDERVRNEIAFVSDEAYFPVGSTIKSVKLLYETLYDCFSQEDYKKYLELFQLDENASIVNLSKGNKEEFPCYLRYVRNQNYYF